MEKDQPTSEKNNAQERAQEGAANLKTETPSNELELDGEEVECEDNVVSIDKQAPSLEEQILELDNQVEQANQRYFRAIADFDNLKKRSAKEKLDTIKYSNESLISDMLPVLDSLDKALAETSNSEPATLDSTAQGIQTKWEKGTQLVRSQLLGVLEKKGLKKVNSTGQKFDPSFHQAIQKVEKDDTQEETVIEEFMAGYELNGRLIRPAMVLVAVPK